MANRKRKPNQETLMFRTYIIAILIVIAGAYGIFRLMTRSTEGGMPQQQVDALADCLTENGAKLYGTYWCPHCKEQKEAFGDAKDRITYVECTVDRQRNVMSEECKDAGITSFPTWVFGDGSVLSGQQPLRELAAHSDCSWDSKQAISEQSS